MKVLVTGAGGMFAQGLLHELTERRHDVAPFAHGDLDITDPQRVRAVLINERPDVVVQCAAYTRVDDAEHAESSAFAVNAAGTAHVAHACREIGARFVYPSTDYVFDGLATVPYAPDARPAPLNTYGRSKLAGEVAAAHAGDFMIVRTSWLYGQGGHHFVATIVRRARDGAPLRVVDDQRGAPTWTRDLAALLVVLLERAAPAGVYHATNSGEATWFDFASATVQLTGLDADVVPVSTDSFARIAHSTTRRPRYSLLDCTATYAITGVAPHWRDALARAIDAGVHER